MWMWCHTPELVTSSWGTWVHFCKHTEIFPTFYKCWYLNTDVSIFECLQFADFPLTDIVSSSVLVAASSLKFKVMIQSPLGPHFLLALPSHLPLAGTALGRPGYTGVSVLSFPRSHMNSAPGVCQRCSREHVLVNFLPPCDLISLLHFASLTLSSKSSLIFTTPEEPLQMPVIFRPPLSPSSLFSLLSRGPNYLLPECPSVPKPRPCSPEDSHLHSKASLTNSNAPSS